ncbi:CDP-diacylglycerol--glycerol-3-phosphate 3-phosphatidyltransferase [Candidatus Phycorickettsia trachydisci]|uniref:CDP-diacylglycerol--glycerol-3-phosphate 3-phosphatidyltransferase n=1 Tax=Candidatus Phycorickettsia trachydisci TaxID=2115978 RepID=A0A2P1P7E8_9RICK|nr:CDP-diacylglycerol--glycerol-3-phosphate 3-phosphatidyltransferase [Candidatus Phycorickettsia trachydisci]AVP87192.1 CDP-diacylglycerol--glycerol-3-phosphate 3-phosphatidyltransferase [Candidatus Phycorickettsia trachydisci]
MLNKKYLPNTLSIIRIFITPIIIINFYLSSYLDDIVMTYRINGILFFIASITDFLDGYIARNFDMESNSGRILDPIADKILVSSILIMLVKFNKAHEIPCILILARELTMSGIREAMADHKIQIPVSGLAKMKTFLQMIAILALLIGSKGSNIPQLDTWGNYLLWIAAILTIVTSIHYLFFVVDALNSQKSDSHGI